MKIHLTKREADIMKIFWEENKALIASDFPQFDASLTLNTVQGYLKKLREKGLIKVDNIVYSGTALTRSYKPTMNQEEFETKNYLNSMDAYKISVSSLVATFLNHKDGKMSEEEIDKLENLIQEQKKLLKKDKTKEK